MRLFKLTLLVLAMTAMLPTQTQAKLVVAPKAYMFGFVANFTDSVIYITDIQTVDSVWYDSKSKLLVGRNHYSTQLREYFANQLNMPHRTCIAIFALTRKEAEKKYLKMKKQYTEKYNGHYNVKTLNENEFHFTTVVMAPEEEQ
jgi:hypothetical protein